MIVLGLGSNIGDRTAYLQRAVAEISKTMTIIADSPVYESQALLPVGAPAEWDIPFLNMALAVETTLTPDEILIEAKAIEKRLGRQVRGFFGPREIDVDVLSYNSQIINEPHLILPHKGLLDRDFALIPFCDVAPDWQHPIALKSAKELANKLTDNLTKTTFRVILS